MKKNLGITICLLTIIFSSFLGGFFSSPVSAAGPSIDIEVLSFVCAPRVQGNSVQLVYCTATIQIKNTGDAPFGYTQYGYVEEYNGSFSQRGFLLSESLAAGQAKELTFAIPANISGDRKISFYAEGYGSFGVVKAKEDRVFSCPIPTEWPKPELKVEIIPTMGINEAFSAYTKFGIDFRNIGEMPVNYLWVTYKITMGGTVTTGNATERDTRSGDAFFGIATVYAPCGDVLIEVEATSTYSVYFPNGGGTKTFTVSASDVFEGYAPCACEDSFNIDARMLDQEALWLTGEWTFARNNPLEVPLGTWIVRAVNESGEVQGEQIIPWTTENVRKCISVAKEASARVEGKSPFIDVLFLSPENQTVFYRRFTRAEAGGGNCPEGRTEVKIFVPEGFYLAVQSRNEFWSVGRQSDGKTVCAFINYPLIVSLIDVDGNCFPFTVNGKAYPKGRASIDLMPVLIVTTR